MRAAVVTTALGVLASAAALAGGPLCLAPRDSPLRGEDRAEQEQLRAVKRILDAFVAESLPEGGIDAKKSLWQKPGTGSASGSNMFPGGVDVRYLRFLVEGLYRVASLTGGKQYHTVADSHVRFMARSMRQDHPTWALGNALEMIGVYHAFNPREEPLVEKARQIVAWVRQRQVQITTVGGVSFRHFPCGYGIFNAKDAGWTNDLSMLGSGLVWAYEVTGDKSLLEDATSFAEYFVQPWQANAVGPEGYWRCGTWREDLGSWVIGPAHFSGFESTGAYGDESSWVFSTLTCMDYLTRLYRHKPDPRFLDRCAKAARWTFRSCQFEDGSVGMCGRDDKWLGLTGDAVTQVVMLRPLLRGQEQSLRPLLEPADRANRNLGRWLVKDRLEEHGVRWVRRATSTDPLVNVGMLWTSAVLGWLNGRQLREDGPDHR